MHSETRIDEPEDMTFVAAKNDADLRYDMKRRYEKSIANQKVQQIKQVLKIGRNDPCPCESGKKFKKCCISKTVEANPDGQKEPPSKEEMLKTVKSAAAEILKNTKKVE